MKYLFYTIIGFLSGSIMYSLIIPEMTKGIDITTDADDENPGAANAIANAGIPIGALCLLLDLLKGMIPVMVCLLDVEIDNIWFALVMAAPVLGHAVTLPYIHKKGGKAIAVSFGVLIGIIPHSFVIVSLLVPYLLFSSLFKIKNHANRTVASFLAAAIISIFVAGSIPVIVGMLLISSIVIYKHRYFVCRVKRYNGIK